MDRKNRLVSFVVAIIFIAGAIYFLESLKVRPGDFPAPSDVFFEKDSSSTTSPSVEQNISQEVVFTKVFREEDRYTVTGPLISQKISQYLMASELMGIAGYINTENIKIEKLKGKVVLVDFWTYSCINCIRTLPYLTSWDSKYRDMGLVMIGVHTPEFGFEKSRDNVIDATIKHGVEYAVVQDNSYATWNAYNNRFWPRKYLIDGDGFIRYDHIGEGGYKETELKIQELLSELGKDASDVEVTKGVREGISLLRSPELYAGYFFNLPRGQDIGNEEGLQPEKIVEYIIPSSLKRDVIYLEGSWQSNRDDLELVGDSGKIALKFRGSEVNIVVDSLDAQEIGIVIDGERMESIFVENPDLYNVYDGGYMSGMLEIEVLKGFKFNAFTFG